MEWQKVAKSFEGIAAYGWTFNFVIRNEGSQSIEGMVVTKDYLQVMGLHPVLGRSFEESDIGTGPVKAILLGYEFWKRTFNSDPQIIGKTVHISRWEVPPTVIGVMQPGVRFLPSPGAAKEPNYNVNALVDFWIPVAPDPKYVKDPSWNMEWTALQPEMVHATPETLSGERIWQAMGCPKSLNPKLFNFAQCAVSVLSRQSGRLFIRV